MELNQIRYVLRVAELQGFSNAARSLGISQPTLTQQISRLEAELGVRLFTRTTRSVSLTNAGRDFVIYGAQVLDAKNNLLEVLGAYKTATNGIVRLGIMPDAGMLGYSHVFSDFSSKYPDVQLEISQASSEDLARELLDFKVDIAIINARQVNANMTRFLEISTLLEENVCALVASNHPLAHRRSVHFTDLADCKAVLFEDAQSVPAEVLRAMRSAGCQPRASEACSKFDALLAQVAQGGLSFLPPSLLTRFHSDGVAAVPLEPPFLYNVSLALASNRNHLFTTASLRSYLLESLSGKEAKS